MKTIAPMPFSQRLALADKVEAWIAKAERSMRQNRVVQTSPQITIPRNPMNVISALHAMGKLNP